jgi:hypothetical protein
MAASFALVAGGFFGAGALTGRASAPTAPPPTVRSAETAALVDVFAAGSSARAFALPGGGRLALDPESMVEVVAVEDGQLTLRLLRGRAAVDTADSAVAVLAGEARVSAPAGSSLTLLRRETDVDLEVASGTAEVSAPTGERRVAPGERLARIPTIARVASTDHPSELPPHLPMPTPIARHDALKASNDPTRAAANEPSTAPLAAPWMGRYQADQLDDAFRLLEAQGGLEATIASAQGAKELMALSDIAFAKQRGALATRALRRVADEFPSNPLAYAAAMSLARIYGDSGNKELAARYRELAKQATAFAVDVACGEFRELFAEAATGDVAVRVRAANKAREVLAKDPQAVCVDDARDAIETYGSLVLPSVEHTAPSTNATAEPHEEGSPPPAAAAASAAPPLGSGAPPAR